MADIGYISLLLALVAAVYTTVAFIVGARTKRTPFINSARNGVIAVCGLLSLSVLILVYALITHQFQIEYVASYTSSDTPLQYLISALWAGNDGSLLFWGWMLSIFAVLVTFQKRDGNKELLPYASSVLTINTAFFLIILLAVANPFHELLFIPPEGRGLNPMLENWGMIFHPPLLLAGYVGLTVPFAFAIAALLTRKLGNEWLSAVRRWMILAWLLLGVGNLIGAWWAYVELGWGGYWAWDPVENAGLMPWLVATAFLHSTIMQKRKGMFKVWNMTLIIVTYSLVIFGTFLTRSGIISSVHTFEESTLGIFLLVFVCIIFFGSLGLLFYRYEEGKGKVEIKTLISKESSFLLNNFLLVASAGIIFLGTLFPAIFEAITGSEISVGPSFFNRVNGPIFLTIILLMGICILMGWRQISIEKLVRFFYWPLGLSLILSIGLYFIGVREWPVLIALLLCVLAAFCILFQWFQETKAYHYTKAANYLKSFWHLMSTNRSRYGSYIIHIAIVLIAIGVIGSSVYDSEKEATLKPGESITIKNYKLTYEGIDQYETPSKQVVTTTLSLYKKGKLIDSLTPEKYFHRSQEQPVTEVAIHTSLIEDFYVILVGWESDGTTAFKILINPAIILIWIGGVIFLIGGLIVFWPESRNQIVKQQNIAEDS
jgi:cytochrome c-type biogenesis protein CcmF